MAPPVSAAPLARWSPSRWWVLAAVVSLVGGVYGIGDDSILIRSGRRRAEIAPAALASTFVTSVAGAVTFMILSLHLHGSMAPDCPTGLALVAWPAPIQGARIQSRFPDLLIRRVMGVLVAAICARYLWSGLG